MHPTPHPGKGKFEEVFYLGGWGGRVHTWEGKFEKFVFEWVGSGLHNLGGKQAKLF